MASQIYIAAMGVVSALGLGVEQTIHALSNGEPYLSSTDLFPMNRSDSPHVGTVPNRVDTNLPRTHELAKIAASQVMAQCSRVPWVIPWQLREPLKL